MKHFYSLMKAMAVVVALFTAVSAGAAIKVVLDPDNTQPVTKLSGTYTMTFPDYATDGINFYKSARLDLYAPGSEYPDQRLKLTKTGVNTITFTIEPAITAPGVYNFVIDSDWMLNDATQAELGEVNFSYTVVAPEIPDYTVSPNPEKTQKRLMGVVSVTFPTLADDGVSVTSASTAIVTDTEGVDHTYRLMNGDMPNQVIFNIADVFDTNGYYTITIPEGSIINEADGKGIKEINWTYTVDTELVIPVYTVTPSLDEPLDSFEGDYSVSLNHYETVGWDGLSPCRVYVYADKDGEPAPLAMSFYSATCKGNVVSFNVAPAITKGGNYYLNIGGFINEDDDEIPEIFIPFTVTGNNYTPDTPVDPGTGVNWSYVVTPDPEETLSQFPDRMFVYFPYIESLNNFRCFVKVEGPDYSNPYVRFTNYGRLIDDGSGGDEGGAAGPWTVYSTLDVETPYPDAIWNKGFLDRPEDMPDVDGLYQVTIPKDSFYIDDDDEESDNVYNPEPIVITYTVSGASGVVATFGEKAQYSIYRMNGTPVAVGAGADAVRALEPGFYIINGKTYRIR